MDKSEFNRKIGEAIRRARNEKSLTQNEIAFRMNMDAQNVSKYERGVISPTVYWVKRFCDATEHKFSDFMQEVENGMKV